MVLRYIRWSLLSALSGLLVGAAAACFLFLLDQVTLLRGLHREFLFFLPFAGFSVGWVFKNYGNSVSSGMGLILDEIHNPKKVVPVRMAPLILFGTLFTHLGGGSAGREGAIVQIGASLADQLSRFFRVEPEERKILLVAGAGASFGAAIGTPWAGILFGMEVISIGRLKIFAWFECLIASFVAHFTVHGLGVLHTAYPQFEVPGFELKRFFWVALSGVIFGLAVILFVRLTHFIERVFKKCIGDPAIKAFIGGWVLVLFFWIDGTDRFTGLGITGIQEALKVPAHFSIPALKTFFSALTLGSGFKGGEFVPLVFVGTTLGSALSVWLPVSFQLLAALGFAAVFAGAANTPVACTIMAVELFGWKIAPYAAIACFVSYYVSAHHHIYHGQRVHPHHDRWLRQIRSWFEFSQSG